MALAAAASMPVSREGGATIESKEGVSIKIASPDTDSKALGFTTSEEEELKLCLVDIQVTAAREVSKVDVARIGMPSAEAATVDVEGKAVQKEGPKETQYQVVSRYVKRRSPLSPSSGAGESKSADGEDGLPKVEIRRVWRSWEDFKELEKALTHDKAARAAIQDNDISLPSEGWYAVTLPQSGEVSFEARARAQALAQRAQAAAAAGKHAEAERAREESAAADPTCLRLALLGEYLKSLLGLRQARDCTALRSFLRKKLRPDWPAPLGPINLEEQDLPHASSVTEWWYLNCHFEDKAGRPHSAFVAFFRAVAANDAKGDKIWMEALNWAITDVRAGRYLQESLMHKDSPAVLADMFDQGLVTKDNMIRKAYRMVFDKKNVPLPDRIFPDDPVVHHDRLELDYVYATLKKDEAGDYLLTAKTHDGKAGIDLKFHPTKPPVRHGVDGVVMGHDGDDMFYYLIPRCEVTGTFRLDDEALPADSQEAQADEEGDKYMWMGRSLKTIKDPKKEAKKKAYQAAATGDSPVARDLAQEAVARLEAVASGRAMGESESKARAEAESKAAAEEGGVPASGGAAESARQAAKADAKPKRAGVPDGVWRTVVNGQGWYDHEFGGERAEGNEKQQGTHYAWNWAAIQLDNGMEVSVATLSNPREAAKLVKEGKCPTGAELGRRVILIDREGRRTEAADVEFIGTNNWTSLRTFYDYPTQFTLQVPSLGLDLKLSADVDDQEFVTIIAKPAFWEGRVSIEGSLGGQTVSGIGFIERNGFNEMASVMEFFKRVGGQVRKAVQFVYPDNPSLEDGVMLIASEDTRHYVQGVDMTQIDKNLLKPVRHISDQGGKSWRSYGALACIDLVGGDSRKFAHWLAMPEFMHVGSLIVDDFQDDSKLRRGVPCSHLVYGTNVSINAGTAAYFQGQKMLPLPCMSQKTLNTVYDLYFAALRAGHAGQALDLAGLEYCIDECIESGNWQLLLDRILAIHRLKTAVPAGSLARMGVYAGEGNSTQATAVGVYFEAVGVAFQIMDDVLNLRGLRTDGSDKKANVVLKTLGEDIMCGKVTMPVVLAVRLLGKQKMKDLWSVIKTKPQDPKVVQECIDILEDCGAITECCEMASKMVDDAWLDMDKAVPDSFSKIMIYTFGKFVINRGV